MMIYITYAGETSGMLNRLRVQLPQPWERRDGGIQMHQSLKPNSVQRTPVPWWNVFGRMNDSVRDKTAIRHKPGSWKISVQYCKSSTERLKRLHSSKCQQQTLNIQRHARHSGVLSCFPSECKNNVKQQPALLLSNPLTGHWNSTSDSGAQLHYS